MRRSVAVSLLAAALVGQAPDAPAPAARAAPAGKVREVRDLAYHSGPDADDKKHRLDLFLPPEGDRPVPIVMWIHGGAWQLGDRWLYPQVGRRFAEAGVGFAAISYRLSPKVQHPAHVQDCARAFAWLHAHVAEHGGDPDRLFVAGQSAGGHLAALLALDPQYLRALEVPDGALKGVIPMSGVYRIPALPAATKGVMSMFPVAFGSTAAECEAASPVAHVATLACPMLVITETEEAPGQAGLLGADRAGFIRTNMQQLRAAAKKAGVAGIEFLDAEQRNHITIVTSLARRGDEPVRAAMLEFVHKRCRELEVKK